MNRQIGDTFEYQGKRYIVKEASRTENNRTQCNVPCAFRKVENDKVICKGLLRVTGDCKSIWRKTEKSVYFVEI